MFRYEKLYMIVFHIGPWPNTTIDSVLHMSVYLYKEMRHFGSAVYKKMGRTLSADMQLWN